MLGLNLLRSVLDGLPDPSVKIAFGTEFGRSCARWRWPKVSGRPACLGDGCPGPDARDRCREEFRGLAVGSHRDASWCVLPQDARPRPERCRALACGRSPLCGHPLDNGPIRVRWLGPRSEPLHGIACSGSKVGASDAQAVRQILAPAPEGTRDHRRPIARWSCSLDASTYECRCMSSHLRSVCRSQPGRPLVGAERRPSRVRDCVLPFRLDSGRAVHWRGQLHRS